MKNTEVDNVLAVIKNIQRVATICQFKNSDETMIVLINCASRYLNAAKGWGVPRIHGPNYYIAKKASQGAALPITYRLRSLPNKQYVLVLMAGDRWGHWKSVFLEIKLKKSNNRWVWACTSKVNRSDNKQHNASEIQIKDEACS